MVDPEISLADIEDIQHLVENWPTTHSKNADGSFHSIPQFSPEQARAIVAIVFSELGKRGYAVMKPKSA